VNVSTQLFSWFENDTKWANRIIFPTAISSKTISLNTKPEPYEGSGFSILPNSLALNFWRRDIPYFYPALAKATERFFTATAAASE
jgi:hypothetical protein